MSDIRLEPKGLGSYEVRPGDGMSSIATEHGFFWQTLWDLPENSGLKGERKNPEVLLPGDRVTIPELRGKTVQCGTGRIHRFRRKGVPARVAFELRSPDGQAVADAEYVLEIDGRSYNGTTGADGMIEHWVAPTARTGTLKFWPKPATPDFGFEVTLQIGHLNPIGDLTGVQARLKNLGFYSGDVNGELGPETREAIKLFQTYIGREPSGELDEDTRGKLLDHHRST